MIQRQIPRLNELGLWTPIPNDDLGIKIHYGKVDGDVKGRAYRYVKNYTYVVKKAETIRFSLILLTEDFNVAKVQRFMDDEAKKLVRPKPDRSIVQYVGVSYKS